MTVSGINTSAPISITGGQYSLNGGAYTSGAGTVSSGQTLKLTASAAASTLTTATLTIGGVTGAFNATTQAPPDTMPDLFSFTTLIGVNPHTTQASGTAVISGISGGTAISVVNGEYKLNNDNWTSVAGVISSSDTVQVRHTSANGSLAPYVTTLTIGTVSATFTTITKP